jgi:Sec-independent protein translocase protein TatA
MVGTFLDLLLIFLILAVAVGIGMIGIMVYFFGAAVKTLNTEMKNHNNDNNKEDSHFETY